MVIRQGDIYWVHLDAPGGSEPGFSRPMVVIQNNLSNASKSNTVIVCALTSQWRRAGAPGNVILNAGEANLPKQSVANVTQLLTLDKSQLGEYIGKLSDSRVRQILNGINLHLEPREYEE